MVFGCVRAKMLVRTPGATNHVRISLPGKKNVCDLLAPPIFIGVLERKVSAFFTGNQFTDMQTICKLYYIQNAKGNASKKVS